jgi:flagellin
MSFALQAGFHWLASNLTVIMVRRLTMPLYINTNVSSLNAQRQLMSSGQDLDKAMTRLSSGMRINSAGDDAAGLSISNRQTAQIRGLDQAVRNANDGISLIQTAEGALDESTNILQRMRELAIQSANGIYGDKDRATLDAEVQQLISELDRIAKTTTFNGQNILDGSMKKVDLQVGSNANETIRISVAAVDSKTLGMGSMNADVVGAEIDSDAIGSDGIVTSDGALSAQDILINGQAIGALKSGDTLGDLVDNINKNVRGVTASTAVEMTATAVGTGIIGTTGAGITVTKTDGTTFTFNVANTNTLKEFADKVGSESGGMVSASIGADGKLSLSAQNVASLAITSEADKLGMTTTAKNAQLILTSDDGGPITVERGSTGTLTDLNNLGFRETQGGGVIESVGLVATTAGADAELEVGELTINGVQIGHKDTDSLQGKINAINAATAQTGVTAMAYATLSIDMTNFVASAADTSDLLQINGVKVDLNLAVSASSEDVVDALNEFTGQTGVSARLSGTRIILESDQGAINLARGSADSFFGSTISVTRAYIDTAGEFVESSSAVHSADGFTAQAGLKLVSANGNPISIELSDTSDIARHGLLASNKLGEGSFGTAIASISVSTAANAQKAIGVIDNALETVNKVRSDLGAVNNRLDFTISNLSNVAQNTQAARARITDADFAAETASLSRAQVLQQASQAMLAQANARPQQVLSLLQ